MNEDQDISNEQEGLKGIPENGNPFKTDNDYFDSFSARLQNKLEGLEEIEAIAPLLSAIPKYHPFEVPVDYFDELPTRIQERVTESRKNNSLEWLILLFRPRFMIPMVAAILIAVAGITYMNRNSKLPAEATEELSLEEHLYDIDESILIETLTAEANTEKESTDDNSIENYLIDNNIDITNLEL